MKKTWLMAIVLCLLGLGVMLSGCSGRGLYWLLKGGVKQADINRREASQLEFASIKLEIVRRMQMTNAPWDVRDDVTYEDFQATMSVIPEATAWVIQNEAIEISQWLDQMEATEEAKQ